jgi:hypothetical protein
LDVCEIGELVGYTGQVKQVKVLGVMALLDEEETDWKIIVIDVSCCSFGVGSMPGKSNTCPRRSTTLSPPS